MLVMLISTIAMADGPRRGDVVRDGKYVPVSDATSDLVVLEVSLDDRDEDCDRTGGRWTWCTYPVLLVRNPGGDVVRIDPNKISADWSFDGASRPVFPIDHAHDALYAYPPAVIPPFGQWSTAVSRVNPNRWGKKLSFDEGQGLDRIYKPGNEMTVTFPVQSGAVEEWFSQRFVLQYDGPKESVQSWTLGKHQRLLASDADYRRLATGRNLSRVGWIVGLAVGGAAAYMTYLVALDSDTQRSPVPFAVVSGVGFTGAGVGFVLDRQKSSRMKNWPDLAQVEGTASAP